MKIRSLVIWSKQKIFCVGKICAGVILVTIIIHSAASKKVWKTGASLWKSVQVWSLWEIERSGWWGREWKSTDLDWEKARTCIVPRGQGRITTYYCSYTTPHIKLIYSTQKSSTQCFTMNYVTQIMRSGFKIYLDLDVQMSKGENLLHLHLTFFCFPFVSDWPLAAIQPGPREAGQLFLWPIVAATFLNPPIVAATM